MEWGKASESLEADGQTRYDEHELSMYGMTPNPEPGPLTPRDSASQPRNPTAPPVIVQVLASPSRARSGTVYNQIIYSCIGKQSSL